MKTLKLFISIIIFILTFTKGYSQENPFTLSGYVDVYYAYDNDKNGSDLRQLSAIAPIRDQFRINLAQITGKYSSDRIRGTATLQFGDIPKYNWPQQPNEYLQYIQEANAGFMPAENLWIDFGFFLTHIGAEGVLPINNISSTLALSTYFEPFFQSGIRVSYDFSPKVYGSFHLLNGYNVLADNNKNKSVGIQLGFRPADNLNIVLNNITGNEQPSGSEGKTRIYNNVVINYSTGKYIDLLFGGDFAIQEKSKLSDPNESASMYGALLTVKYKIHPKFNTYIRGEIFNDENGFLSGVYTDINGNPAGLKATGVTLGFEHSPVSNAYLRLEGRYLNADSELEIFTNGGKPSNTRAEVVFTTGVMFP